MQSVLGINQILFLGKAMFRSGKTLDCMDTRLPTHRIGLKNCFSVLSVTLSYKAQEFANVILDPLSLAYLLRQSQWALPDLNRELQIPVGTRPGVGARGLGSPVTGTSTASSRSQWALPDLNRESQIAVGTAGLQPRAPDRNRSGHCRTSSASSRSQWALPDFRTSVATARSQWALPDFSRDCQIPVGTAGLQPRAPDPSGHRTSAASSRAPDRSGHCRTSAASSRSQWAAPDFSRELQIAVGTAGLQPVPPYCAACWRYAWGIRWRDDRDDARSWIRGSSVNSVVLAEDLVNGTSDAFGRCIGCLPKQAWK
eukprot:s1514_g7.t1